MAASTAAAGGDAESGEGRGGAGPRPAGSGGSFRDPAAVDMIVAHNELVHAMEDQAAEGAQEEERKEESAAGKRLPRVAALAGGRQGGR